ncbi:MAG: serine/threonine protein kinase [Planctomycetes bacterium]|nr:serine/threonine protein kinase [Planctomycetota bacterium]
MNSTTPQELFGYRVVAKLGSGAASELYAVQDAKTKQVWALKHVILKTDKDARFIEQVEQEYAIGSKLDHPNVRGVLKISYVRKLFKKVEVGLLMELVDADPMDVRRPQTLTQAVDQFRQIARGLQHMHEKGFVHADMKPINAMVDETGHVKIIDLGQACAINTKKSRIQGTPGYIAPEQARREGIVAATDVYNLGATMHWVLVGSVIPTAVPPAGDGTVTTVDIERIKPPEHPSKRNVAIPQALGDLILDCVKVHIEDRPSMTQVIQRLESLGTVGGSGWEMPPNGVREGT